MEFQVVQRFFVHHRVRASFFIFIALWAEWASHARPLPLDIVCGSGALLVIAGAFLRSWAAGIIEKRTVLATQGPYALTRHPLYLGSFMIMMGFALALEDKLAIIGTAAVILFIYLPTIRNEERLLGERFGNAWLRYTTATGLFLPKRMPAQIRAPWHFDRWRHHREYRAFVAVLLSLLLFELWRSGRDIFPF